MMELHQSFVLCRPILCAMELRRVWGTHILKGRLKDNSRFPGGMTERKARASVSVKCGVWSVECGV